MKIFDSLLNPLDAIFEYHLDDERDVNLPGVIVSIKDLNLL